MEPPEDEQQLTADSAAGEEDGRIRYMRAYEYVFDSSDWVMNLLFLSICQLIPVVGSLLMLGYQFEIIEALHRRPQAVYPKFDFNKFVEYLTRGVWPLLVSLVVGLAASVLIVPLFFCVVFVPMVAASGGGEEMAVFGFFLTMAAVILLTLFLTLVLALFMVPMALRAGLAQEFGAAFDMGFVKDFIRRMWKEIILEQLFILITGTVLALLGMLICIGIYPAAALIVLAQSHLYHQLYRLYLARGGTLIPLKARPVVAPPIQPQ